MSELTQEEFDWLWVRKAAIDVGLRKILRAHRENDPNFPTLLAEHDNFHFGLGMQYQKEKERQMDKITGNDLIGATIVEVDRHTKMFGDRGRWYDIELKLKDGREISLTASGDGYGATWIEVD